MLKRLCLALAGLFAFVSLAQGAGTVPGFSLTPQFDLTGKVAPGCKLYVIQAGTVLTPQNAYQDSSLTLLQPNPMVCDAGGRLPQWFVADGSIKLRLTDKNGTQIFSQDGLLVIGASSGGGGGSPVDPTTIMQTGHMEMFYGTGVLTGFVRCNGRTIGSATSGATERANADAQTLFQFLWGADANLTVSGGRGASANADWVANKTLTLPDCRGRVMAGLADMGNSAASWLTSTYFGTTPTTLGAVGGSESHTLTIAEMPVHNHGITDPGHSHLLSSILTSASSGLVQNNSGTTTFAASVSNVNSTASTTTGISVNNAGSGSAHAVVQPTILVTTYIKL